MWLTTRSAAKAAAVARQKDAKAATNVAFVYSCEKAAPTPRRARECTVGEWRRPALVGVAAHDTRPREPSQSLQRPRLLPDGGLKPILELSFMPEALALRRAGARTPRRVVTRDATNLCASCTLRLPHFSACRRVALSLLCCLCVLHHIVSSGRQGLGFRASRPPQKFSG